MATRPHPTTTSCPSISPLSAYAFVSVIASETNDLYTGGYPLAQADNGLYAALRAAHDAKRREAGEKWQAFETARELMPRR